METKVGDLEGLAASSTKSMAGETKPEAATAAPKAEEWEDAPDPDEDDLDDLDGRIVCASLRGLANYLSDMLDEFSSAKAETKTTSATATSGKQAQAAAVSDNAEGELSEEDFAKQLQAGMADLLGELGSDPDMKAQFEEMMKSLGGAGGLEGLGASAEAHTATTSKMSPATKKAAPTPAATEESFQETIKKTMERMQASGDKATAASTEDNSDDILAELMKQMASGGMGEGGEEDFSKMLLGMMEQLTNKEILYEPMKELDDKFPAWMEKNKDTTSKEDMARYKEQQTVVHEIVARFEQSTYSDANAADREYIVDRMQKVSRRCVM